MKLDEKQLQHACEQALQIQIDTLPDIAECPVHHFDELFEQDIQKLITDVENGLISPAKASMGWQYYIRKGTAAVLIGVMLLGVTMPGVLLAGYKIIQAEISILPEYTEHHYQSSAPGDSKLKVLQLGWLPKGMQLDIDRYRKHEYRVDMEYIEDHGDVQLYFNLKQKLVTENSNMTFIIDTENAEVEVIPIGNDEVTLVYKNDNYQYIWLHDKYHISGQSNLSRDELVKILENISFSD